jgi:parallel beta-helix repeat protein
MGDGPETALLCSSMNAIDQIDSSNVTIRNLKITPNGSGTNRAAIRLVTASRIKIENVAVAGQTDANGVMLFDCDNCLIDNLYFDGSAATKAGNGVYGSGCQDCKIVNSHAVNCFAGFCISGYDIDSDITPLGAAARSSAETYGNSIENCTVRNCTSQAFNINASSYNTISNCHAEDYAGASTHKAFQVKDPSGDGTRGNIIIGCTAKNYPAGFGAQQSSHTQIIGCTARDLTTNFIELNSVTAPTVTGCSVYEFAGAGIWLGGGTANGRFDDISLVTSTATAIGIQCTSDGNNGNNNFDNVTTSSTLAKFIDIASGSTNNRFGRGCRSSDNLIADASGTSVWPIIVRTDAMDLTASGSLKAGPYLHRGMHIAVARFVVTTAITGAPTVQAGSTLSNAEVAAAQAVTGVAGATVTLTLAANGLLPTARTIQGRVSAAGSAGAGFVQYEGLPRL